MAAKDFTKLEVKVPEPTVGYEVWVTIWHNRGRGEVMIGAPTLDTLRSRWEQITSSDFDASIAQNVALVQRTKARVEDSI